MSKKAVRVELVDQADANNIMRFVAVLNEGWLFSEEMFGYAQEWGVEGDRTLYPFILTDEDGTKETYVAEWGAGDSSQVFVKFAPRALETGQGITRVDVIDGRVEESIYRIESIQSLLD